MPYIKKFVLSLFLITTILHILVIQNSLIQVKAEENQSFPLWVIDNFGRNITISHMPERIVSLAPGNTEILFALGLGDKVVGVTRYCNYPPEVIEKVNSGEITIIGGYADPNVEIIIDLNPDLVIAESQGLQGKVVDTLEKNGFTVIGLDPKSVSQIIQNIILVGRATGKEVEAEKLANELNQRIDYVVNKVKNIAHKPRAYFELWYDPLASIGPGTWIHELIEMAGGENIFSDANSPYPLISSEAVIERNPEVIIIPLGYMGGLGKSEIKQRPGWDSIEAVKNDRICEINEDIVYRPGPRIVEGLEQLAKIINPELFVETKPIELKIETDPAFLNILFSINGEIYATDSNGKIAIMLDQGDYTIQLMNLTVTKGPIKYAFAGWRGIGKTNPLRISLTSNKTLIAVFSSCLIITATYGSELFHKINSLRNFRDTLVMSTFAGNSFMSIFNKFYYSFSPYVAEFLTINEGIRTITKLVLYPLIFMLEVAELFYSILNWLNKEFAIIASGIVTSSLIGIVYCSPVLIMVNKLKNGIAKKLKLKPIIAVLIASLIIISIGEILNSSIIVGFGASILVLATIVTSATLILLTLNPILKLVRK
ncbi:MAG: cobalamin-binding protein [Candidatus Bathyarchaeia archaeon]